MLSQSRNREMVVTVTGLPASGSEIIAHEVGRLTGKPVADKEISQEMCRRLKRTLGEIDALESSFRSWWVRLINAYVGSWEQYASHDPYFSMAGDRLIYGHHVVQDDYLSKYQYVKAIRSVIGGLAREGSVVLHGHGSHLHMPCDIPALNVFVKAPKNLRIRRVQDQNRLSHREARKWLRRADSLATTKYHHLLEGDINDASQYDMVLNLDAMSHAEAARLITLNIGMPSPQVGAAMSSGVPL